MRQYILISGTRYRQFSDINFKIDNLGVTMQKELLSRPLIQELIYIMLLISCLSNCIKSTVKTKILLNTANLNSYFVLLLFIISQQGKRRNNVAFKTS